MSKKPLALIIAGLLTLGAGSAPALAAAEGQGEGQRERAMAEGRRGARGAGHDRHAGDSIIRTRRADPNGRWPYGH